MQSALVTGPGRLRVVAMTPPGRLPVSVHDPGGWWRTLAHEGADLQRWSANAAFWTAMCSPRGADRIMDAGRGPGAAITRLRLRRSAAGATAALLALGRRSTFKEGDTYASVVADLAAHLRALTDASPGLEFGLPFGVVARDIDYSSSAALADAARFDGRLARLIEPVLDGYPTQAADVTDVVVVAVTSPSDLLLAMVVIDGLRTRGLRLHAILADHGYENFTLKPHLDRLRAAGTLDAIFDTIVETKDDRDLVVPAIVRAIAAGDAPRGFVTRASPLLAAYLDAPRVGVHPVALGRPAALVPPPVPTFAPEPILVTRLSARRCYWARCAFCVHNDKYDERRTPSRDDIPAAVDSLEAWLGAGYRMITLNDEAISPASLDAFCAELERRAIAARFPDFRWICRSKVELKFNLALFRRMRAAGGAEVLFGLESASARVRRRMDKEVRGLDEAAIRRIVREAGEAGIGIHLNVIAGFPGETLDELDGTIELLGDLLADLPGATYNVNPFVVFPATPVADDPGAFGIEVGWPPGDMPAMAAYRPLEAWTGEWVAISAALPSRVARLDAQLGWSWLTGRRDGSAAMRLIHGSGHGTIFKVHEVELRRGGRATPAAVA